MHHAITVGGLLLGLTALIGLGMCAYGLLATFAGGMSDNPEAGATAQRSGCTALIFGGVLFGASLWGMLS